MKNQEGKEKLSITMLRKRKSHTHTYTHTHYVNERICVNIESGKNSSRKKIGTSNEENKIFVKLTSLCTSIHTVFFFFLNLILNYQSIACSIYVVNTWSFLIRRLLKPKWNCFSPTKEFNNPNWWKAWLFALNVDWTGWKNRTQLLHWLIPNSYQMSLAMVVM